MSSSSSSSLGSTAVAVEGNEALAAMVRTMVAESQDQHKEEMRELMQEMLKEAKLEHEELIEYGLACDHAKTLQLLEGRFERFKIDLMDPVRSKDDLIESLQSENARLKQDVEDKNKVIDHAHGTLEFVETKINGLWESVDAFCDPDEALCHVDSSLTDIWEILGFPVPNADEANSEHKGDMPMSASYNEPNTVTASTSDKREHTAEETEAFTISSGKENIKAEGPNEGTKTPLGKEQVKVDTAVEMTPAATAKGKNKAGTVESNGISSGKGTPKVEAEKEDVPTPTAKDKGKAKAADQDAPAQAPQTTVLLSPKQEALKKKVVESKAALFKSFMASRGKAQKFEFYEREG